MHDTTWSKHALYRITTVQTFALYSRVSQWQVTRTDIAAAWGFMFDHAQ